MKVLFLTREYPPYSVGGIAKHVFWLSKSLAKLGVKCKVLSFGDPSDSSNDVLFITPKSSLCAKKVSLKDNLMILQDIKRLDQIADDVFDAGEFDILHVVDPYLGPFIKSHNNVTTVHDTSVGELRSMIHNVKTGVDVKYALFFASLGPILEYSTLARAKAVIAVNQHIKDELTRYYRLSNGKVKVIPNGVIIPHILSKHKAKKELGFPQDHIIIFSACRVIPRKRLDVLIRAIKILVKNRIVNLSVIICGDGPQRVFLQNLVKKNNLMDRIRFEGWVSEKLLQSYYEAADIFVLTSEYEGHPISLLEALSYEAASVCSNIPSIMLTDGVNGLKFECGNHEQLAEKLELLIQNPKLRFSISRAGGQLAKRFDWQKVALETRVVYERLLSEGD
jgi:glycogen(starch) synthase